MDELNIGCSVLETDKGMHFYFKGYDLKANKIGWYTPIGVKADFKLGVKNTAEPLKINGKARKWIRQNEDFDPLPKWLYPTSNHRNHLSGLQEGDGRNQKLFNYILQLQQLGMSRDEIKTTIKIINRFILSEPLPDSEIKTILRDEAFLKESFFIKNTFLHDKFAKFLINEHHIILIAGVSHIYKDGVYSNAYLAQTTIKRSRGVNGSLTVSGEIFDGESVLNNIDRGWSLVFDGERYAITYKKLNDKTKTVEFDAIQQFFWDFSKSALYQESTGSHPFQYYIDVLFQDSGYTYDIETDVSAFEKENWGYKNKLDLFNDVIKQADVEFEVNGTNIRIDDQIGRNLTSIVRQGVNISDLVEESKISDFATYGRGFGAWNDSEDHSKGRLEVEYASELVNSFGKLAIDPSVDERYTIADNLKAAIKEKVDATYSVSITANIYDLQSAGYSDVGAPEVGDWIMAIDDTLNFKRNVRIIKLEEVFNAVGKRVGYTATCGDLSAAEQYQQSLTSTSA